MICPGCMQQINDDSAFCGKCGHKIPRCPSCNRVISKRMNFCIFDGTAIPEDVLALLPQAPLTQTSPAVQVRSTTNQIQEIRQETGRTVPQEASARGGILPPKNEIPVQSTVSQGNSGDGKKIAVDAPRYAASPHFCLNCGTPISADSGAYCADCALKRQAHSSGSSGLVKNAAGTRFCVKCGAACREGESLCDNCQEELFSEEPKEKKRHPGRVVSILLLLLLLIAAALEGTAFLLFHDENMEFLHSIVPGWSEEQYRTDATEGSNNAASESNLDSMSSVVGELDAEGDTENDRTNTDNNSKHEQTSGEDTNAEAENEVPSKNEQQNAQMIQYEHTYHIVAADLSWEEAKAACEKDGGHLATITSQEEYDKISKLATSSGLTYLWIGGNVSSDTEAWGDSSWITGEKWTFEVWYSGEPSRSDEDGTMENCLCLWNAKYGGEEIGWTYNDQRNDLVSALPSVSGKLGYVCEHEIEVSGTQTVQEEQYILAGSDSRYLTADDLKDLSEEELRLARNEIYARHGRKFIDESLQAYFDSCDWYEGTIEAADFQESSLNDYERKNLDLIAGYEEVKGYR